LKNVKAATFVLQDGCSQKAAAINIFLDPAAFKGSVPAVGLAQQALLEWEWDAAEPTAAF
jgi:hypothetical protein